MKYLLTLSMCLFFCNGKVFSQNLLSLSGSRYYYTITNKSKVHLKVTNSKTKKTNLLSPSKTWTVNGNFGRKHYNNTRLICNYDNETYGIDKDIFERLKSKQLNQVKRNLDTYLKSNNTKLLFQFGLIGASNVKTNPDDWLIVKFLKGIGRVGSEWMLEGIDFFNTISELQDIHSVEDLFEYLNDNYGYGARQIDEAIKKIDFLDYKSRKRGINAIIGWAKAVETDYDNYDKLVIAINREYEQNIQYIDSLYSIEQVGSYTLKEVHDGIISFKTKTPIITFSLSPLHYGNGFNGDWGKSKETVLADKDRDDKHDFEDGLWNRNFGGKVQFAISPEMSLSRKSQARLLLGVSYFKTAYSFDSKGRYSANFFSQASSTDSLQIFESETLDDQRVSAELAYKMYLGKVFTIEFVGGLSQVKNYINYKTSELVDGFTWANAKISLSEKYIKPYGGLSLGVGVNKFHRGYHLTVGCRFFQFNDLKISDSYTFRNADTDLAISFKPENKWNYRINVGMSVGF